MRIYSKLVRVIRFIFIFFSWFFVLQAKALVCTNLKIHSFSSSVVLTGNSVQALTVEVQTGLLQVGACPFILTFSYGGGGQPAPGRALIQGSDLWPYVLSKDSIGTQILHSSTDATAGTVLSGSIPAGQSSVIMTYYISVDSSNPWRKWGNYQDSYTINLYENLLSLLALPMDSKNVSVQYDASKKTDLSLVDSGASFNESDTLQTLNFGNLVQGSTMGFDLIMKYNAGVKLFLSSENSGNLKHTSAVTYVPYILKLNGITANLVNSATSRVEVFTGSGVSPTSGYLLPVQVIIGSTGAAAAGEYNDKVTFTVESTE